MARVTIELDHRVTLAPISWSGTAQRCASRCCYSTMLLGRDDEDKEDAMAKSRGRRGSSSPSLCRVIENYGEVSTHPVDEVLRQWGGGELSPEQAVGHLMQHIARLYDQMDDLRTRLVAVERAGQ